MKKYLCIVVLLLHFLTAFSQTGTERLFDEAQALFKEKKLEEGLQKINTIIEMEPANFDALAVRIYLNVQVFDNFQQVFKDCENIAVNKKDGKPAGIFEEIAFMYVDAAKFENALKLANRGMELFPDSWNFHVIAGESYQSTKQFAEAIREYNLALSKKPDYTYALDRLAKAYFQNSEFEKAFSAIGKAIEIEPEAAVFYDTRSNFYSLQGDYEKALADNARALELAKSGVTAAQYFGKRAFILKDMGNEDEACKMALRANELGDELPLKLLGLDCSASLSRLEIKPGTNLFFEMSQGEQTHLFQVQINKRDSAGIEFSWAMTEGVVMKGRIFVDKNALENARSQYSFFEDGKAIRLTDKSSVWVSKAVYKGLKSGTPVEIDAGDGPQKFRVTGTEYYSFLHGPEEDLVSIQVIVAQNEDGSKTLLIADDAENPLVVQMDSGWKIGLFKMM